MKLSTSRAFKLIMAALSILLLSLSAQLAEAKETLKIGVTSSGYSNIFAKIKEPFEKASGIEIEYVGDYKTGDSVIHFQSVLAGKADASTSANPFDEFKKVLKAAKVEHPDIARTTTRLIGRDLMRIFTHPKLDLKSLTVEQVADIYSGKLKNWKELGGKDLPIQAVVPFEKRGTVETFRKLVLHKLDFRDDLVKSGNYEDVIKYVATHEGAIGLSSSDAKSDTVRFIETPPIGRPIYLLTIGKPSEKLQKLIDFIAKEGPK